MNIDRSSFKSKPETAKGFNVTTFKGIQQAEYYEPMNANVSDHKKKKEKLGFWQVLFREKKCNSCLQKKRNCTCKVKKKKEVQSNFNTNDTVCEKNTRKEIQKAGSHPMNYSVARRGCGCQFYFCIDNKHKNNQSLNKKPFNNNKIKLNTQISFSRCVESDKQHKEGPKITILCEEEKTKSNDSRTSDDLKATVSPENPLALEIDNNLRRRGYSGYSRDSVTSRISRKQSQESTFKFKEEDYQKSRRQTNPFAPEQLKNMSIKSATEITNLGKNRLHNWPEENLKNNRKKNSFKRNDPVLGHNFDTFDLNASSSTGLQEFMALIKAEENLDKTKYVERQLTSEEPNKRGILRPSVPENRTNRESLTKIRIDSNVRTESAEAPNTDTYKLKKRSKLRLAKQKDPEKETILSEFDYKNYEKRRQSKVRNSGVFVKNSLINLRKQRRSSQLQSKVSQILIKLNYIEDKISDIEKKCEKRNKNVTLGISCEPGIKQSRVSIKFKEKDKASQNPNNVVNNLLDRKTQYDSTVKQEGFNATPKQARDKMKQKVKSEGKQPASYDLHPTNVQKTSSESPENTGVVKCINPKIIIQYPQKNHQSSRSPVFCDKWRRISEELKISQPVVKRTFLLL